MMPVQAPALAGARGRLLPLSIPFRFFVAAGVYHLLFWLALLLVAPQVTGFRGGGGPVLATVHLLTLGVFTMTAIGASLQLLSVATRRPIRRIRLCRLLSWLLIPGVGIMAPGMVSFAGGPLLSGMVLVALGLLLFAGLIILNLLSAPVLGVATAYAWAALLSLLVILLLGVALAGNFFHGYLDHPRQIAVTHMALAAYGFMGMLTLGYSYVLVPMFSLSTWHNDKLAYSGFFLNTAALLIVAANPVLDWPGVLSAALITGTTGVIIYLWSMRRVLQHRMRRRLGFSFALLYLSWGLLLAGLLLAGLVVHGVLSPMVYGVVLLPGWLLTFLLAILQRIVPFLASMHSSAGSGKTLTVSALSARPTINTTNAAHLVALTLLLTGVCLEQTWIIRVAALAGLIAGIGLLGYLVYPLRRLRRLES